MPTPSWYLDPLVARQKRRIHQQWIRDAARARPVGAVLKTDLFEEAYGEDRIFDDLFPGARLAIGIDKNEATVRRAALSSKRAVSDVRELPFPDSTFDAIVSTSTLDHFASIREIERSLDELTRVLRPGGLLLITLDNPRNPLYYPLRWMSRRGWAPFELGETLPVDTLEKMLTERGFAIENSTYLIHNPRGISTLLFLGLRKSLGRYADGPIRALLAMFATAGHLPSRSITGCFLAVAAVKKRRLTKNTD